MADDSKPSRPELDTPNPSINPETGKVNPSAPTAGTEGWGNTADERETLSEVPPSMAGSGDKKKGGS